MSRLTRCKCLGEAIKYSRQPKLEVTASPGLNSWARDSMTSPTAPPSSGLPNSNGGTYDFPAFMRPRMYGSTDMKRLRTSTCWSCSGSSSVCARVKLSAVGIRLGREASRISRLVIFDIKMLIGSAPRRPNEPRANHDKQNPVRQEKHVKQ